AASAMAIVKRTPALSLAGGEAAPSRWRRAPTVKKKSPPARGEVALQAAGTGGKVGGRRGFGCFAIGVMMLLALQHLMACGAG
ncbi:MAG TPA: hypothetical protein VL242_37710, partial [Sorangium sp.]|nr:hypothetical protein [Sorangium sp.]